MNLLFCNSRKAIFLFQGKRYKSKYALMTVPPYPYCSQHVVDDFPVKLYEGKYATIGRESSSAN